MLFCLDLGDPSTFLASVFWGPHFPLRTACLFTRGFHFFSKKRHSAPLIIKFPKRRQSNVRLRQSSSLPLCLCARSGMKVKCEINEKKNMVMFALI